jgi:hypothetical protein
MSSNGLKHVHCNDRQCLALCVTEKIRRLREKTNESATCMCCRCRKLHKEKQVERAKNTPSVHTYAPMSEIKAIIDVQRSELRVGRYF